MCLSEVVPNAKFPKTDFRDLVYFVQMIVVFFRISSKYGTGCQDHFLRICHKIKPQNVHHNQFDNLIGFLFNPFPNLTHKGRFDQEKERADLRSQNVAMLGTPHIITICDGKADSFTTQLFQVHSYGAHSA